MDELLTIYGIADEPADYVVVVDTSGSMMTAPAIFPDVRRIYAEFIPQLGERDHLAVVTFDASATVRFNGTMDEAGRAGAANALPDTARGARTDIGAAVNAALDRLARPDGATVQTLVFLTDGRIDAPGSIYGQRGSVAWRELAARAEQLTASRSVAVYGAGLGGGPTDIDALKDVFPRATIVNLPTDQLGSFFAEAVRKARIEKLRSPVTQELERNVLETRLEAGTLGDTTTLTVRVASVLPHLGASVSLRDVAVTDETGAALRATLVGGPRTFTVGPGKESDPFQVQVEVPELAHDVRVGQVAEERRFLVTLDAGTEVEPANILVGEVAIEAAPQLLGSDTVRGTRMHGIAYWMLGAAALGLALLLLFLRYLYLRLVAIPRLRGGISLPDGTTYMFRGRVDTIPNPKCVVDAGGASVEVFTRPRAFTKSLDISSPRIFVRRNEGSAPVSIFTHGGDQELSEGHIAVFNSDQIVFGKTRLTVVNHGKKGKRRT